MYVFQTRAVCPQGTGPFVKDSALTLRSLSMYTAAFSQTEHERQAKKNKCQSQYWPLSETSPWCSSYLLMLIIEAVTQRLQNKSSIFKEYTMDELREALSYKYAMLICSMQKSIDSKYIQCN